MSRILKAGGKTKQPPNQSKHGNVTEQVDASDETDEALQSKSTAQPWKGHHNLDG
jgi:hypothetical protein